MAAARVWMLKLLDEMSSV